MEDEAEPRDRTMTAAARNSRGLARPDRVATTPARALMALALSASALLMVPSGVRGADLSGLDVGPLRAQLNQELQDIRKNYNGDIEDYRRQSEAVREK